jgi:LDH2 family malate/lactate/ureidoglycolate dehydrogenase
MADDRMRLSVEEARALGERALARLGYDAEASRIIADHVIDAALCGYEYSGLAKILNIPEHYRFARPRGPMRVVHDTPVSTMFDGGNECGMLVIYHATKAAIAKAQTHGIALIGVTNTWMSGRSGYFMEMVANADLVGMHTAASLRVVAPPGALKAALGTNPIAFGMPSATGPLVFDMGTSAFMATELKLRERLHQELPEGVALDVDGNPTRDPGEAMRGALLTWGGYKGFGLSLMVQALGVFGGSGFDPSQDEGYLIIVFRPDLLCPLDQAKQQLSALIERVKATPRAPGVDEIRIPGERSFRMREQLLREGLEVDRAVVDALEKIRGSNA